MNKHRVTLALLFGLALTFSLATRLQAQGQVTDDEFKVTTYKRFVDNREPNPGAAYQAAKEYMARYNKEDDQYTRYLKQWIAAFEKDDRQDTLLRAIYGEKNYASGFGLAKQVLADDPEDIKALIALGYGGYLATNYCTKPRAQAGDTINKIASRCNAPVAEVARLNNLQADAPLQNGQEIRLPESSASTFNADAERYAQKAIQLLEGGKNPDAWEPFKSREDTIASLNYAIGFTILKTRPEESIARFLRVIQIDSDLRKTPSPYSLLAGAYEKGPYRKLSTDYSTRFANQAETPESKAALENINKVMDRIIDAYARAVALAGNEPQYQAGKAEWTKQLTTLYKFRHENSDAGLNEFIAGVLAKPLGSPDAPSPTESRSPVNSDNREILSGNEIFRRSSPSVVMLVTENTAGKPVALGSGFFVTPNLLVTNYHVIKGASRVRARLIGQATARLATVVTLNQSSDLAVLRVEGMTASPLPLGNAFQVGEEIYAVGSPEGLEGTFSQGIISALRGTSYIQITAPISHGSSGGPVLNKKGEVIGVAVGAIEGGQNLNFAIPVNALKSLLSSVPR